MTPFLTLLPTIPFPDQKRRIRERTAEEVQINARAAHCGGLAPVTRRDFTLGQVFRSQTADELTASESARANSTCHAGKRHSQRPVTVDQEHARFKSARHEHVGSGAGCN